MEGSRVVRGVRRVGALALAGGVLALASAVPAQAAAGESTERYVVAIDVRPDGTMHVTEALRYTFVGSEHHGIERFIPIRYRYIPDPNYDRVLEITNVRAASPDAPDDVSTSTEGNNLRIRVGDPDQTVSGTHEYTIDYDVKGALNAFDDHVELYWNAIPSEWEAPIAFTRVTVTMPAKVVGTTCFVGPEGASLPCDRAESKGRQSIVAHRSPLGQGAGLTLVSAVPPAGFKPGATDPILEERWSLRRAFSVTPWTVIAAVLIALLGLALVARQAWRNGRDSRWAGEVPGLSPPSESDAVVEKRGLFSPVHEALEFTPPDGMRAGQLGTVMDERVDTVDVSATLVDLAVRGYLRIEELPRAHWFASRDWKLVELEGDVSQLLPYEKLLLAKLFADRTEVLLSELKQTFAASLSAVKDAMYVDAVKSGFFRRRPDSVRRLWTGIGIVALLLACGATYALARWTTYGLLGIALIVIALGLLLVASRMPARTAKGSAALSRILGFRRYIRTAEAEQLRFEEGEDLFSRYLPYAIVYGETERWAKVFAALAAGGAAGAAAYTTAWYVAPDGWTFDAFGDSLDSFSDAAGSAMASAPASSGSGGGGSSGGGFGGGGGGSW